MTLLAKGMPIASPIGFMAAMGLLRVLSQDHGLRVSLSWRQGAACFDGIDEAECVALLRKQLEGRAKAPEFTFLVTSGKTKSPVRHVREITPEDYRRAASDFAGNPRALDFLAGIGTDAVVNDKGFVARTKLDFTAARQELMTALRGLAQLLDPARGKPGVLDARIHAALQGGRYEAQTSFGWDPASVMAHAHQPEAPTKAGPQGRPMLVWLAAESLPLHPVVPIAPGRARTTGFDSLPSYTWPEWSEPLSWSELRLLRLRPVESLHELSGVTSVWRSSVVKNGDFPAFAPAARTQSERLGPKGFAQGFAPEKGGTFAGRTQMAP